VKLFDIGIVKVCYNKPVVTVQRGDELGEVVVRNARSQLPIQFIDRFGREGMIVNGLDGRSDLVGQEDVTLAVPNEILQALVGAIAGATLVSELACLCIATLLFHDAGRFRDKFVVIIAAR